MAKIFTYLVQVTITLRTLEIDFFVDKTFLDKEYFLHAARRYFISLYLSVMSFFIYLDFPDVDLYTLFIVKKGFVFVNTFLKS